jgi:peptidoglycan/LPS O-acetylase OafA/YrhL
MAERSERTRLGALDALRGFAAIGVSVFSHFQHFGGDKKTYPYRGTILAGWLYDYSWLFVDLFFLVSGVVFTYQYFEPISTRRIGWRDFFTLRMSRLYPLHVATLLACAAVEWTLEAQHKALVIYERADVYHFFLQLFYLHTWLERGWSFNEPSWSVCGEVFVYALFFYFCWCHAKAFPVACGLIVFLGMEVQTAWPAPILNENIARAMVGFFAGALLLQGIQAADRAGHGARLGLASLGVLTVGGVLAWKIGYAQWIGMNALPHVLVVFPLVIVTVLRVEPIAWALSARPFAFLGDISYAVYLMHVPLQMVTIALTRAYGIRLPITDPRLLWGYMAVLVAASAAVHYGFERPTRRWLRRKWLQRTAEQVPAHPV